MVYALLVLVAWGSLVVPLPTWAKILMTFGVLFMGGVLLLFGMAGSYWDSHMTPGTSSATSTLLTGILLLLSRAVLLFKLILHALVAPPWR